jgi:hypothetical protein
LVLLIIAPLQSYADLDFGRWQIDEPPTPVKNKSDRIGSEDDAVVQIDVLRFH